MLVATALEQARQELDALSLQDWKVVPDTRPTRRLGQTRFDAREIGLSVKYVELNTWDVVRVTVRHEAAHALVGPGYAHGPIWKRKARELDVPLSYAMRVDAGLIMPSGKIDILCPTHGRVGSRTRMPSNGRRFTHAGGCGKIVTFQPTEGKG